MGKKVKKDSETPCKETVRHDVANCRLKQITKNMPCILETDTRQPEVLKHFHFCPLVVWTSTYWGQKPSNSGAAAELSRGEHPNQSHWSHLRICRERYKRFPIANPCIFFLFCFVLFSSHATEKHKIYSCPFAVLSFPDISFEIDKYVSILPS